MRPFSFCKMPALAAACSGRACRGLHWCHCILRQIKVVAAVQGPWCACCKMQSEDATCLSINLKTSLVIFLVAATSMSKCG